MTTKYTIVLIRHGESEYNKVNRFCGWYDADLSEVGVEEAKAAGQVGLVSFVELLLSVSLYHCIHYQCLYVHLLSGRLIIMNNPNPSCFRSSQVVASVNKRAVKCDSQARKL